MQRFMDLKDFKYSSQDLTDRLKGSSKRIDEVFDAYSTRRFYVGDVEIPRKTLNTWKNLELLPYKLEKDGWQKLSFVECCWLLTIKEFSQLGISLKKILLIKKALFPSKTEKLMEVFKMSLEKSDIDAKAKKELLAAYNHPNAVAAFRILMKEKQYSFFYLFIQNVINEDKTIYLVYDKLNRLQIFFLDKLQDLKAYEENLDTIKNVFQESFVGINLRTIAFEFLLKEKKRHTHLILEFLNEAERKILNLVREGKLKEITISYKDNKPATIYITRNEPTEAVIIKIAGYLKKGSFKKVEFRTRNGQLIHYDETDILKVD